MRAAARSRQARPLFPHPLLRGGGGTGVASGSRRCCFDQYFQGVSVFALPFARNWWENTRRRGRQRSFGRRACTAGSAYAVQRHTERLNGRRRRESPSKNNIPLQADVG